MDEGFLVRAAAIVDGQAVSQFQFPAKAVAFYKITVRLVTVVPFLADHIKRDVKVDIICILEGVK